MSKLLNRLISLCLIFFVAIMPFMLVACGDDENKATKENETETNEAETQIEYDTISFGGASYSENLTIIETILSQESIFSQTTYYVQDRKGNFSERGSIPSGYTLVSTFTYYNFTRQIKIDISPKYSAIYSGTITIREDNSANKYWKSDGAISQQITLNQDGTGSCIWNVRSAKAITSPPPAMNYYVIWSVTGTVKIPK